MKQHCDSIFGQRVRLRGKCERCYRTPPDVTLQCSHIVSRKYLQTRWSFDNALCLCLGCHHWWHHFPLEAEEWCRDLIGDDLYDDLKRRARRIGVKVDYDEVLDYLRGRT